MTKAEQTEVSTDPLVKEITVPLAPERAFALFTDGIATWWPLASHSVARANAVGCRFEPRVGGRLLEVARDGSEHVWGRVRAWEPPARLVVTWHPGREAETAQELSVTFSPEGNGTRIRLVHAGWELLGDAGRVERDNYDPGWDYVLGRYVSTAG
ncbi:SRPBCC family protein [soil metagenome]